MKNSALLLRWFDLTKHCSESEFHHAEEGFAEDTAAHFAATQLAVDKDHGHFCHLESQFVCSEFHFDLEGIPLEADSIEVDSFQYLAAIALESRCCVVDLHAEYCPYIYRSVVGHDYSPYWPVNHADAVAVS